MCPSSNYLTTNTTSINALSSGMFFFFYLRGFL